MFSEQEAYEIALLLNVGAEVCIDGVTLNIKSKREVAALGCLAGALRQFGRRDLPDVILHRGDQFRACLKELHRARIDALGLGVSYTTLAVRRDYRGKATRKQVEYAMQVAEILRGINK